MRSVCLPLWRAADPRPPPAARLQDWKPNEYVRWYIDDQLVYGGCWAGAGWARPGATARRVVGTAAVWWRKPAVGCLKLGTALCACRMLLSVLLIAPLQR